MASLSGASAADEASERNEAECVRVRFVCSGVEFLSKPSKPPLAVESPENRSSLDAVYSFS